MYTNILKYRLEHIDSDRYIMMCQLTLTEWMPAALISMTIIISVSDFVKKGLINFTVRTYSNDILSNLNSFYSTDVLS